MTDNKTNKKVVSIYIDEKLYIKTKVEAARKKISIGEIIETALRKIFNIK